MTAMTTIDPRITCPGCVRRLGQLGPQHADTRYRVGNNAKPQMGHKMFFVHTGRIALCIAQER